MPWVKQKAAADLRPVACHLLAAAVDRQLQAAAVRLWPGSSASASDQEQAVLSAREEAAADQLWFPGSSASASDQEQAMLSAREKAAADQLWFRGPSVRRLAR